MPGYIALDIATHGFDGTSLPLDPQINLPVEAPLWISSDSSLSPYAQLATQNHVQPAHTATFPSSNATSKPLRAYGHNSRTMLAQNMPVYEDLLGLGGLGTGSEISSEWNIHTTPSVREDASMFAIAASLDKLEVGNEADEDVEGVMEIISPALALDRDVQSNSLPYVLSSFLKVMARSFFEPMKRAPFMRDFLIQRCTTSNDLRYTATLLATAADLLGKSAELTTENLSAINLLEKHLCGQLGFIKSRLQSRPEVDRSEVYMVLWHMHEMVTILSSFGSMAFHVRMLDQTAAIYQLAYADVPGTPIHLQSRIADPVPPFRHTPVADVLLSLSTCRPMIFCYDTTVSGLAVDANKGGLQWRIGIPDQLLVVLALMNTLRQKYAPNLDSATIDSLEVQITSFKPNIERSGDSYLYIARLIVQECWRQFMYIYLYMGLCGANSHDPCVKRVLKRFIKTLDSVKPGRMPDAFLVTPMSLAGIAAYKDRDRAIVRQRLQNICGPSQQGTYVNDALLILETIWTTADAQHRPAVWLDLRFACAIVTGIV
ncbi:Fungal specific transcription factor domain [Ceratobasidium sp. AG-Ba]|nr:Fungal specific transcription factor domain [Ceratobasidium sp. AG-Ba]